MLDLLPVLMNATKTLQLQMKQWFSAYPPDMPWTVVSDYCIGDVNKKNDVLSFVVIANHDTAANICDYIARAAPRDIKAINQIPLGLVQYLGLQVTYSLSFVLERSAALLRDYIRQEEMVNFIPDLREFIESLRANSASGLTYFDEVLTRVKAFEQELLRPQMNLKLARQIHLAAAFAAVVFAVVNSATQPGYLRWISDRDALIERHDGIVYDLAYLYFLLIRSNEGGLTPAANGRLLLEKPQIQFELPEKTGKHRFDELIRLPDYLAGTMADLDLATGTFSREKFGTMLNEVFLDRPNNWVVQALSDGTKITMRSVQVRSAQKT